MKKILVVDDEVELCDIVAEQLVMLGYTALVANSGNQALEILKLGKIDAVVCDVKMPDGDGVNLMQSCRKMGIESPFLFMTAYEDQESDALLEHGAIDVIGKPTDVAFLEQTLTRYWNSQS